MHTYIHHVMYPRCFPEKEHQLTESSNVPKLSCSCIVTLILLIQNPYFTFIYTLYFSIVIDEPLVSSENPQPFTGRKGRSMPQFNSVAQSCLTLWPHGLQNSRLPCPPLSLGICSNSCQLSRRCHATISSFIVLFSSCFRSFSVSESFPMSWLFESGA